MRVAIIPNLIGAFGLEDLVVGGRVEAIQTTALLRTENWEESWRLEETCGHLNSSESPSANTDVKNSKGVKKNLTKLEKDWWNWKEKDLRLFSPNNGCDRLEYFDKFWRDKKNCNYFEF